MAKAKEVTTKFRVDLTEFSKGIQKANADIKLANAQFKAASAGMDNWANSSEGLSAKISQLNTTLSAEKDKLVELKNQQSATIQMQQKAEKAMQELEAKIKDQKNSLEQLTKTYGENSDEVKEAQKVLNDLEKEHTQAVKAQKSNAKAAQDLEIKILNQQATISKTEKELNKYETSLTELNASNNKVKSSFEKLEDTINDQEKQLQELKAEYTNVILEQGKNSKSAKDLAKKMTDLNQELSDSKTDMAKAESAAEDLSSALKDIGDSAKNSESGFTVFKATLADLASNVIQNAASKIGDLVSSIFELADATEEYRSMNAKLEGSAQSFGYSVEFANEKYKEFYKYLEDDQMATNAITNLMGLGLETDKITKLADGAIGVWASYGDSIPIESLTESINETIQVGKVTGVMADTINWAKVSNDEMTKALGKGSEAQKAYTAAIKDGEAQEDAFSAALEATTDEKERAEIVARFLNDTYGKSKQTYDELTGSIQDARTAELELKETQAEIGEQIEPLKTKFTEFKNQGLEKMQPVIEKVSEKLIEFMDWIIEKGPKIKEEFEKWEPAIVGVGTAIATYFVVDKITAFFTAIKNGTLVMKLLTAAQAALNIVMNANPIGLIIAAVAGLVAAFVVLWNKSEKFRNFWIGLWEGIKETAITVWEAIKGFFSSAWEYIQGIWSGVTEFFSNIWEGIKEAWSSVFDFFTGIFTKASDGIKSIWNSIVSFFSKTWEVIKKIFSPVIKFFANIFGTVFTNIKIIFENLIIIFKFVWSKIVEVFTPVVKFLSDVFAKAWNKIKSIWNTVVSFFQRVWNGIKDVFNIVASWFREKFQAAWTAIKNIWNAVAGFFQGVWNGIKKIFTPVIEWFSKIFSSAWNGIKSAWSAVSKFFSGIWSSIKNVFSSVGSWFKNIFTSAWEGIKSVFSRVGNFFGGIWDTIKEKFSNIGQKVGEAISGSFKKAINGLLSTAENVLNFPIKAINKLIGKINDVPGISLKKLETFNLPRLATGDVAKKNNPFLAVLGDNKKEDEVISPISTMKKAMSETLQELISKERQILSANNISNTQSQIINNNFYQTNNSPKALSRLEIYRQTHNLLSARGGA